MTLTQWGEDDVLSRGTDSWEATEKVPESEDLIRPGAETLQRHCIEAPPQGPFKLFKTKRPSLAKS